MGLLSNEIMRKILDPETRKKLILEAQEILASRTDLSKDKLLELWSILGESFKFDRMPFEAEKAYLQAVEIVRTINSDDSRIAEAYIAIGDSWAFSKDYGRGIGYYDKAITSTLLSNDLLIKAMSQIAYAYSKLGNHELEQEYLRALINQPSIEPIEKGVFLERLALSLGTTKDAVDVYEEALGIFERENFFRFWEDRVRSLARLYEAIGEAEGAQRTLKRLKNEQK